jgi:hypothetical protein
MTQVQPDLTIAEQRQRARVDERRPKLRERRYVDGEGHDLVVDDVRCDRAFEDANAKKVREEWEAARDDRRRERDAERRRMTDGQRLDRALMQIELGTGRRARRIEAATATSDDRSPGGRRPTHVDGVDAELHLRVIRHHLGAIEELLEAELGLIQITPVADDKGKGKPGNVGAIANGRVHSAERRRVIWDECEGILAQQVADEMPYLATSARTVMRYRRDEADIRKVNVRLIDGVKGEPMTKDEAAAADARLEARFPRHLQDQIAA